MTQLLPARRPLPFDPKLLYVLAVPFLLFFLTAPSFFFDPAGWLDPFFYVGYFLHYGEHLPLFDDYYKVSRLPWVLPGYACYHAFGPLAGSYVLHLGTLSAGLAALYLAARDSLDCRSALLGSLLLGSCTFFHGCGGWNYHMTATTSYFLLTALCLNRAAGSAWGRGWVWYLLAGCALACAVWAHLFMAVLVPGLVVHYVLSCRAEGRRLGLLDVPAGLLGALASTGLLCLAHRLSGGQGWFFMPQIRYTLALAKDGNPWFLPLASWLPLATWLALPAAALLSIPLAWLLGRPGGAKEEGLGRSRALMVLSYHLQLLLACGVFAYYQLVKKQTILDRDYMAVAFLGPVVLALAASFHCFRTGLARASVHQVALGGLLVFCFPLLGLRPQCRQAISTLFITHIPALKAGPILLPLGLALLGVAVLALARRARAAWWAGLLLLGLCNAMSAWSAGLTYTTRGPRLSRDLFDFVIEADRFASDLDPTLLGIKYWFDPQETAPTDMGPVPTVMLFDSFVSTRGWMGNLLGCGRLAIPAITAQHLVGVQRLGVLTTAASREEQTRLLRERFAALGHSLPLQAERSFQHGQLDLHLAVFLIEKTPASPAATPGLSQGGPLDREPETAETVRCP